MKPYTKDEKSERALFLKKKWGLDNNSSNEALERTHQDMLLMYMERPDGMVNDMRAHMQAKMEWESKWRKEKQEEQYLT